MFKRFLLVIAVIFILALAGSYVYLSKTYPNTSPLFTGVYYLESMVKPHAKLDKHVMGFLPYWRIEDSGFIKPHLLSEINYFSLNAQPDGSIGKVVNGETDPGWREFEKDAVQNLITKSHIAGTDFTVTVAALDNTLIETILTSPTAQKTLTSQITDLIKSYHLDGVNVDFEYFGVPDPSLRAAFTAFSKDLNAQMEKETPNAELSLSVMPLAAREPDLFEFQNLSSIYDRFIGMSYDFYGENSQIAGPIAPMTGYKDNKFFFDVETMYEDLSSAVPKEKIVMGIPYYGWDWAVYDGPSITSGTLPKSDPNSYAAVISYARAREDANIKPKQCSWDDVAMETWCWYKKGGVDHQVWIADNKSVGIRFDHANKQNLGGIGIWVLGYDKNYKDLWEMIEKKFAAK